MPAFLDSGDRRLVAGALIVTAALVGLLYVLRPAPSQQDIGSSSSYSAQWLGTKAAFLLLRQMGYRVERWESPPTELPESSSGITLIFAEPFENGSSEERAAVSRFVSLGGRLIVMGASGASFAPQSAAKAIPSSDLSQVGYTAQLPSPLSHNAPEVTMVAPDDWTTLAPGQLSIYAKDDKRGVVWYRFGKGEVIWWSVSSPMSNGSIREKNNLALFLNSIGPRGSRILWDEYFHGMRRSLSSYFSETPLPWAGLQIAIAFAALVFTFSRRSGPVRMPAGESRTSPLEFVDTLGDLYQTAHAAPAAVSVAYQRLRLSLTRKLAIPAKVKLPELCRAASARFGLHEDTLFNTCLQAERATRDINLGDEEALDLVQALHSFSDRLETRPKAAQENRAWK
jgi:hypothetical protein